MFPPRRKQTEKEFLHEVYRSPMLWMLSIALGYWIIDAFKKHEMSTIGVSLIWTLICGGIYFGLRRSQFNLRWMLKVLPVFAIPPCVALLYQML